MGNIFRRKNQNSILEQSKNQQVSNVKQPKNQQVPNVKPPKNQQVSNVKSPKNQEYISCVFDDKSKIAIPLKKIDVNITIKGFIASVESLLTFENNGDKQMEAVFKFPIDDSSTVYKFEADIDGRKIVTECQEKKQANENYNAAVQSGHVATILEEDFVSDIFICKIGNLLPKKTAVVKFSYVTEISIQADGSLKFVLPTLLNPRYNPDVSKGGLEKSPSVKRVAACDQPYEFSVKATILGLNILNVTSSKDKVLSSLVNGNTEVKLQDKFVADHDFELEIVIKEPNKPFALMEKGSEDNDGILKQDIVMLNLFPELDESVRSNQHEFLFVIDRSGSMGGPRIESAKESLLLFLKSLPPDCYFNIIGFGSTFELLFKKGSEKYTKESLKKALKHQKSLSADLGGTEILKPLESIYSKPILPKHSRNIFLITDGGVCNTEAVISLVQKHSHDTRIFTLGIGEGASTALIKGVARAGKGKAEFVKSDDKMSPVVIKLLKCAMQSTFTDIKIDWQLNGASCIQVPKVVPPIFHNDHTVVYALINNFSGGKAVLSGTVGDKSFEFPMLLDEVNVTEINNDMPIHRMAAKSEILRLQTEDEKESNKSEIILLSVASNVISRYTALVGVDKVKNEVVVENTVTCFVPIIYDRTLNYSQAWMQDLEQRMYLKEYNLDLDPGWCYSQSTRSPRSFSFRNACKSKCSNSVRSTSNFTPVDSSKKMEQLVDNLIDLVSSQTFEGFWIFSDWLCKKMNLDYLAMVSKPLINDLNAWGTVLVLEFFNKNYSHRKDEWELIELKALNWLSKQDLNGKTEQELFDAAKNVLTSN